MSVFASNLLSNAGSTKRMNPETETESRKRNTESVKEVSIQAIDL